MACSTGKPAFENFLAGVGRREDIRPFLPSAEGLAVPAYSADREFF